jgi:hypothetical protein
MMKYIIGSDDINEDTIDEEIDELSNTSTRRKNGCDIVTPKVVSQLKEIVCIVKFGVNNN